MKNYHKTSRKFLLNLVRYEVKLMILKDYIYNNTIFSNIYEVYK